MSLVINHNSMATNVADALSGHYGRLQTSTQRLSTGLRINSAADDAAGLAIRELMRSDVAAISQGIRNANDAISMLQVADGALAIIDEKLIRMKELAEQAATGTYDSTQRQMINSEFQAMGSEIDRIAFATNFNGQYLLDGSREFGHDGSDVNASGKIKIHFGSANDSAEDYYYVKIGDASLRGLGLSKPTPNWWDAAKINKEDRTIALSVDGVKAGTDSPNGVPNLPGIDYYALPVGLKNITVSSSGGDGGAHKPHVNLFNRDGKQLTGVPVDGTWAGLSQTSTRDNWWNGKNGAQVVQIGKQNEIFNPTASYSGANVINQPSQSVTDGGATITTVTGMNETHQSSEIITISEITSGLVFLIGGHETGYCNAYNLTVEAEFDDDFIEMLTVHQTGGAIDIDTQELAQKALVRLDDAMVAKDKIRAHVGALQNRLENTVTNITGQSENLQASESRISDANVATEMTNFVRNQILTQSAVAMLAQANSIPQMAIQLIGG